MVAPPFGETGGPEVVTNNLTEALLEKGVDVTLFAPADWKIKSKHIATIKTSIWNAKDFKTQTNRERSGLMYASQVRVLAHQKEFDLIHLHAQRQAYAVCANANIPCVVSVHSVIDPSCLAQLKKVGAYVVSLSKAQKGSLATIVTIWNGVPVKKIKPSFKKGKYCIAVGRLSALKGIDRAITIAKKANKKLLIFGRIGISEKRKEYFNTKIRPFIDGKQIILMKEVSHNKIYDYLRNAEALLLPISRPEVCPMVVAEALSSGTPVIGTMINPLPELLKNKKVAFLSNDMEELVKATKNIEKFDRKECRRYAEKHFDSAVMADQYLKLYKKVLKKRSGAKH